MQGQVRCRVLMYGFIIVAGSVYQNAVHNAVLCRRGDRLRHLACYAQEVGCINLTSVVQLFKTCKIRSLYEEIEVYI
jgi:hypothetical protein